MIIWYSGCGNTKMVAGLVARQLSVETVSLADVRREGTEIALDGTDTLGLFFPVYAWSVPRLVRNWLKDAVRRGLLTGRPAYVYAVCTCGDTTGHTRRVLEKDLRALGLRLDAFFAVQMPETYVNLPGFNLDPPERAMQKIAGAKEQAVSIADAVRQRRCGDFNSLTGPRPWLRTYILSALFYGLLITDRKFTVDVGKCTSCGTCVRHCPLDNIKLADGLPRWGGNCTNCMACYHGCPAGAIHFGKATVGKGQYNLLSLCRKSSD